MISMCRVFSCIVGRGCLLWPVRSLGKTLLVFALLHSVFQGQVFLLYYNDGCMLLYAAIRSSWSESQSSPSLVLLTVYSFSIFSYKEYNQCDLAVDHLVMSRCRVVSCVVGRGCLIWQYSVSLIPWIYLSPPLYWVKCFQVICLIKCLCSKYIMYSENLW